MSKRKISEVDGSDGADPDAEAKTPSTVITGWGALPPELIRRVGQLQTDPGSLASMERTCRSWKKVVVERNDDAVMDDKANLWRDLTLAKFPRLPSILTLLVPQIDRTCSWKDLYRTQLQARVSDDIYQHPEDHEYQPKTNWEDYITTVEFYRDGEFLFATSGIGDRTPPLWSQKIKPRDSDGLLVCAGPLDPELSKRMGDDPFGVANLERTRARVVITRLSDMKAVELSEQMTFNVDHTTDVVDVEGGDRVTIWNGKKHGAARLPLVRNIRYSYHKENDSELELGFNFNAATGKVTIFFERILRDRSGYEIFSDLMSEGELSFTDEMMYLEIQCPWPN